ncbi:hypothetical protein Tco_1528232 [Tanacetum coccineum]
MILRGHDDGALRLTPDKSTRYSSELHALQYEHSTSTVALTSLSTTFYSYISIGISHYSSLRRSLVLGQPQDEANAFVSYISGTRRAPALPEHEYFPRFLMEIGNGRIIKYADSGILKLGG